jgi:hypothetical protein
MGIILQLAYIVAIIAGLLAIMAAAYYTICWLTLIAVRCIPIIGKKHRHRDWYRLTARGDDLHVRRG